ncbi:Ubiquinone biosynthesis O-methyltransferase [Zancudomyces culisetae]|uniref:Ubiquinone biosynthesis O-methyltransferase n=1 Tax=Zancudomyces culisetae TaxID=1213189 RepID=A0A1R1PXB2_ZANCU|nr:Ubiquinone biosynthesis O-methyltransferase [Zancudomyces culisetae]|eukprot:OMH85620.1 Ubiquinone biosynthesis O-methyltransferase [Zancudomyces culisetae]
MNPTRVSYVREMYKDLVYAKTTDRKDLKKKIQEYDSNPLPFKGVSIVDVGCGGGFLSEPVCRVRRKRTWNRCFGGKRQRGKNSLRERSTAQFKT